MRKIDGKFHIETDDAGKPRIVKTSNGEVIPEDEPLFLLRARDYLAMATLCKYAELCKQDGCNEYQMNGIYEAVANFSVFASNNKDKMKQPGITKGM